MSRNEDYLDNLLTSVTDKLNEFDDDFEQNRESLKESYQTQNNLPSKTQSALDEIREENFIKEFEDELRSGGTDDDFLREFEQELSGEADDLYASPQTDEYVGQMEDIIGRTERADADQMPLEVDTISQADTGMDDIFQDDNFGGNLDDILNGINESDANTDIGNSLEDVTVALSPEEDQDKGEELIPQMANEQGASSGGAPEGMEGLEDIFGDLLDDEGDLDSIINGMESGEPQASASEEATQVSGPILDERLDGLDQIMSESDDDALAEIGKMFDTGDTEQAGKEDTLAMGPDFSFDEAAIGTDDASDKKKKKEKNPNSLFGKVSRLLFGTPAELDPEAAAEYEAAKAAMGPEPDPNEVKEKKKQEKELKKQQKKEEAEKKKQEKEAAKAEKEAKKASKPKKEKKPKQKNKVPKEPPLPKVPVTMMWIVALSLMVLIFLGTSLIGYSSPVNESKEAFDNGDYVTAYTKLQGINVRSADEELLHAASTLAGIQTELNAYNALMEQKQYEMALDALVRGYGRCNLHSAEAEEWGVTKQLTDLENTFDKLLKEQFDVSKRKAKKLYQIKRRSEYTLALHEILEQLGLNTTPERRKITVQ